MNVFDLSAGIKVDLNSFQNDLNKALLMAQKLKTNQQMSFGVDFDVDTDEFNDKIQGIIDRAKEAGQEAYVDGEATIDTSDFESGIDDIIAQAESANDDASVKGNADLDIDDFSGNISSIIAQANSADTSASVNSDADLNTDSYNSGINAIITKATGLGTNADTNSDADLNTDPYDTGVDAIIAKAGNSEDSASIDAEADLNTIPYDVSSIFLTAKANTTEDLADVDSEATLETSGFNTSADSAATKAGELESAVGDVSEEAVTADTNLSNIAKQANYEGVITGLESIETRLTNIIKFSANAVKSLVEVALGSSTWADDLITESQQYGIEVEKLQRMRYASKFIDTDVGTIEGSMQRLIRNMASFQEGSEEAVEAFNKVGVTAVDEAGNLRPALDVFFDIVDALHVMGVEGKATDSEISSMAMDLLGRNIAELGPIIQAGAAAYREMMGKAPVVAEEQVSSLGELNDAYQDLTSQAEVTKLEILGELAPAFTEAATKLSEFVQKFREFIETEEGQEAIGNIKEAFSSLIDSVTQEENIETVFDVLSSVITKISDAFQWISDNKDGIVTAFEAIGGAIAAIKVAEEVLTFVRLVQGARGFFGGLFGGTGAGASAGASAASGSSGVAGIGGKILGGAKTFGVGALSTLKAIGASAAPLLGPAAFGITLGAAVGKGIEDRYIREEWGQFNEIQSNILDYVGQGGAVQNALSMINDAMTGDTAESLENIKQIFAEHANELYNALPELEFWDMIADKVDFSDGLDSDEINKILTSDINALDWIDYFGRDALVALAEAVENNDEEVANALEGGIEDGASDGAETMEEELNSSSDRSATHLHNALQEAIDSVSFEVPDYFRYGNNLLGNLGNYRSALHASAMSRGEILSGLTPFGVDGRGTVHYGGESGPEAVVGVNSLDRMIYGSVQGAMMEVVQRLDGIVKGQNRGMKVVLDTGVLVGETVAEYDTAFEGLANRQRGGRA